MTELLIFWIAVVVVAVALATLREIYTDGDGHHAPPRSHYPDEFGTRLQPRH